MFETQMTRGAEATAFLSGKNKNANKQTKTSVNKQKLESSVIPWGMTRRVQESFFALFSSLFVQTGHLRCFCEGSSDASGIT